MTKHASSVIQRREFLLAVLFVITLMFGLKKALPVAALNLHMVDHLAVVSESTSVAVHGAYPIFGTGPGSSAVLVKPGLTDTLSPSALWTILRLSLKDGDYSTAATVASLLPSPFLARNDLAKYDVLLAEAVMSPAKAETRLARLASKGINLPRKVTDSIAVAVLRTLSEFDSDQRLTGDNLDHLRVLTALRSTDLWGLLALHSLTNDPFEDQRLEHEITTYPEDGLLPKDPRLYPFVYRAIPELFKQRLWSLQETIIAVDTLLQRCIEPSLAREMIEEMMLEAPSEGAWARLLSGFDGCQETLSNDEASVSEIDPNMTSISASFLNQVPWLDLSSLGPNMINNGDFTSLSLPGLYPTWWQWACPQLALGEDALFIANANSAVKHPRESGVSIVGLWRDPEKPGVCGYYQANEDASTLRPLALDAHELYLLSFDYVTEWLGDEEAGVLVAGQPDVFFAGMLPLPKTKGCWNRVYLLGSNSTSIPQTIDILLYNGGNQGGLGRVEFDNVTMQSAGLTPAWWQPGQYVFQQILLCD